MPLPSLFAYFAGTPLSHILYYLIDIPRILANIRRWPLAVLRLFRSFLNRQPFLLEFTNGYRLLIRTPGDAWSAHETFLDRHYQKASVPLEDDWVIIDIGADIGSFSIYAARQNPHGVIYAYEPFKGSFDLLRKNLQLNGIDGRVQVFNQAVSGHDGIISLDTDWPEPTQYTTVTDGGQLDVPCVSLDTIFNQHRITACDYLKIDCEGSEYDILFQAGPETMARIKRICMEYHDNLTDHTHEDLVAYLEQAGFEVSTHPNPTLDHVGMLFATYK
jgi:FkbM family methyltransferase